MKLMIASDIHGSAMWCEKLLSAYREEKADKLVLLGDLLYHGPRNNLPDNYSCKSVIALLNDIKDELLCVKGNCDSDVDQMVLDFPIMAEYAYISLGKVNIFATHGHKFNPKNLPPLKKGDILLNGHTHIPACQEIGDVVYMNPGSVSLPKENSHHGYMIFENDSFYWRDFDGKTVNSYTLNLKGEAL